jgi:hypothetical protein
MHGCRGLDFWQLQEVRVGAITSIAVRILVTIIFTVTAGTDETLRLVVTCVREELKA